jgi:MFS family permease
MATLEPKAGLSKDESFLAAECLEAAASAIPKPEPFPPNVITFDNPDPLDPRQWPRRKKLATVLNVSVLVGVGQMSSSMVAPAVIPIMREFEVDSPELGAFIVSVFMLGVAFGLLTTSGLSEVYGRAAVFYVSNIVFVAFAAATSLATSMTQLIVFRFLLGVAAAAPASVGGGVIGDMFVPEERGRATSLYAFGMLIGPLVGPLAGGYLAEGKGWRWVNWVITILVRALSPFMIGRSNSS